MKKNILATGAKSGFGLLIANISGEHDISDAVEYWCPLLQNAPAVQHIIMSDTGHAPQYQYPGLTTAYIKSFIDSTNRK